MAGEYYGDLTNDEIWGRILGIGPRLPSIFKKSAAFDRPTNVIADQQAEAIIEAG
ncbi:MAG: hypothetical protein P8M18_01530 [Woeseiaceae bacterium]|nr:hypothetical protein [Woeseiaceae bacterium]